MHSSSSRPQISSLAHPLNTGRYILTTQIIKSLAEVFNTWLSSRVTGAMVVGSQRLGKTRAIEYMKCQIKGNYPKLTIINIPCRYELRPSESAFFTHILECSNNAIKINRRVATYILRHRLHEYLRTCSEESGYPMIIFILDDAQYLGEWQYLMLMNIYNELSKSGIHLGCYLFGQYELSERKSAFQNGEKKHLISRFMTHEFKFSGLLSAEDVRFSLAGYDNGEFPRESGWTYTRYYFPEAYDAGWRAESMSEDIWAAFMTVMRKLTNRGEDEIPMEYFTRTIEWIFQSNEFRLLHVEPFSQSEMIKAIECSGFVAYRDSVFGQIKAKR